MGEKMKDGGKWGKGLLEMVVVVGGIGFDQICGCYAQPSLYDGRDVTRGAQKGV